jgi:signal transduction histidine kinase
VRREDARPAAEFRFLIVAGDPAANFLQRSPLSEFPPSESIPGLIGYFEVDAEGGLSTPLLPGPDLDPAAFGLTPDEVKRRLELQSRLLAVLSDNRLVPRRALASAASLTGDQPAVGGQSGFAAALSGAPAASPLAKPARPDSGTRERTDAISGPETAQVMALEDREEAVTAQSAFDRLSEVEEAPPAQIEGTALQKEIAGLGRVEDLTLDEDLEQRSRRLAPAADDGQSEADAALEQRQRARRKEQTVLPAPARQALGTRVTGPGDPAAVAPDRPARITAFETEIEPFDFRLLDSGQFVMFRRVWQDRQRLIQGMLIERQPFLDGLLRTRFATAPLAQSSDLFVAYGGDVLEIFRGNDEADYASRAPDVTGSLLYRARLPAPLDGLELIFSLTQLPAGPGSRLITWVSVILALVLMGGFFLLYRLGAGQIGLAQQQQDFVAAVSHELKTPLTSIRMYGEMLRSGWGDENQRQRYYGHIQDESERLSRLIENVLQMARMTRSDPSFELRPEPVGELLTAASRLIEPQVERAGFDLQTALTPEIDASLVTVDRDCFAQVLINLVDNAIKFAAGADNRTIVVGAEAGPKDAMTFSVRDFGPGIARDQRRKIFRLFYRPGNELTRETSGTGIGLALVHQLVTAMGGEVDVVNRDPGAEFRFTLPLA